MLNRTNRTLSANLLGLNLGTRSFATSASENFGMASLRLRSVQGSHPGVISQRDARMPLDPGVMDAEAGHPYPGMKPRLSAKSPRSKPSSVSTISARCPEPFAAPRIEAGVAGRVASWDLLECLPSVVRDVPVAEVWLRGPSLAAARRPRLAASAPPNWRSEASATVPSFASRSIG